MFLGFCGGVVVGFALAFIVSKGLIAEAKTWGEQLLGGIEKRLTEAIQGADKTVASVTAEVDTAAAKVASKV